MQETRFDSWVGEICWRRDRLPTPVLLGFPCSSAGKESTCNAGDLGSTWVGKIPGRRAWQPTPVFWPGEFHGLCSPQGYRRPRFDSRVRKICWRRDRLPTPVFFGFPDDSADKESACNAGDLGSIPGLGRSPGEGKGCPLQYSGLENSMDYAVHGVTKSPTGLSALHFHAFL